MIQSRTYLIGRQTEPHGAITLASPNIPYTPSTAFFGLFAVTAWSKRSANSFGRRRRSHGRRSQGSRNGCSWGGCLRIGWRRSARTGRHRPFPIADLERPIKHGTAWTNVGRDELPPCALEDERKLVNRLAVRSPHPHLPGYSRGN